MTPSTTVLATFDLEVTVIDHPSDRRRWNGEPMPSQDADEALHDAIEAVRDVLRERGFEIARSGYGVRAKEIRGAGLRLVEGGESS